MKKVKRLLVALLVIAVFFVPVTNASAKRLEVCRHCGGSCTYQCVLCGNTGWVTCESCEGHGSWKCPGPDGVPCDNGWFVCTSCGGDGHCRTAEGVIVDGYCGNCGGAGRIECIACHGTGNQKCHGCSGNGICECQVGTCIISRSIGWKCPNCYGTGYNLLPVWGVITENDGTNNIPVPGDEITNLDGYIYIYGGSGNPGSPSVPGTADQGPSAPAGNDGPEQDPENATDSGPAVDIELPESREDNIFLYAHGDPDGNYVQVEFSRMEPDSREVYLSATDDELAGRLADALTVLESAEVGRFGSGVEDILNELADINGLERIEDAELLPVYFDHGETVGFPVRVSLNVEPGLLDGSKPLYVYLVTASEGIKCLGLSESILNDDGSIGRLEFYTSEFGQMFTSDRILDLGRYGGTESDSPPAGPSYIPDAPAGTEPNDPSPTVYDNTPEPAVTPSSSVSPGPSSFPFYWIVAGVVVIAAAAVVLIIRKKKK